MQFLQVEDRRILETRAPFAPGEGVGAEMEEGDEAVLEGCSLTRGRHEIRRLPDDILDRDIDYIIGTGIKVELSTNVGEDISASDLEEKYDAVYISIGAHDDKKLGVEGEDGENVIRYSFYEIRIKYNLTEQQTNQFLMLLANKLDNLEYNIYFSGQVIKETGEDVPENELLVAVKRGNPKLKKNWNILRFVRRTYC